MPRFPKFKYKTKSNGLIDKVSSSACSRIGCGMINHGGDESYNNNSFRDAPLFFGKHVVKR